MISWLRGLGSSLHRDCLSLQKLTWSGSAEGSSFGLNVTAVLEVQAGQSQGLGQASTMPTTPLVPVLAELAPSTALLSSPAAEPGTGHRSTPS